MLDAGEAAESESAQVKLLATEMAVRVTNQAMQLHGGNGYTTERRVERYWRDARLTTTSREPARSSAASSAIACSESEYHWEGEVTAARRRPLLAHKRTFVSDLRIEVRYWPIADIRSAAGQRRAEVSLRVRT